MMDNRTISLNHDYSQCIQGANHFGYTLYVNICTGTQHAVHWGGLDWIMGIFAVIFATVIIGIFGIIGTALVAMVREG